MPVPALPSSSSAASHATVPLHRIRFFDHTPSPIVALSFAPLPLPPASDPSSVDSRNGKAKHALGQIANTSSSIGNTKPELGCLVVARENGTVEVWEYVREDGGIGNWTLDRTLPPTLTHPTIALMALVIRDPENFHEKPYSVPKAKDLRLFTAGSDSSELTERCLSTGRILQTYPIPSPPLWSLTVSPTQSLLCLSTNSPNLHFLSIPPPLHPSSSPTLLEPTSHLLRTDPLPSRIRTVSVAWGPPKLEKNNGEWSWRDTFLVTGNSDSSFRKWELPLPTSIGGPGGRVVIKARAVVERIKGKKISQKGTIVWGVGVLPDGSIVTSDSLGSVTFWDGATMAQRSSFRSHKADAMCLVIGPAGRTVFTSGPDQRVCQFTLISSSSGSEWALTSTKRLHIHDVRSLSIFPPYLPLSSSHPLFPPLLNSTLAPILASGGWDMSLALTPCAPAELLAEKLGSPLSKAGQARVVFDEAVSRKMAVMKADMIQIARGARLVLGRKDRSIGIWRIFDDERGWDKVLEMDLKLRTNLIGAAISDDGRWVAVSDLYETKLFRLDFQSGEFRPRRVRSFLSMLCTSPLLSHLSLPTRGTGSSALLFTPDAQRLVLALSDSGSIVVVDLPSSNVTGISGMGMGNGTGMNLDDESDEGKNEKKEMNVSIVKVFAQQHRTIGGRILKGRSGEVAGGESGQGEVEAGDAEEDEGEDDDEKQEGLSGKKGRVEWVDRLAVSGDGQWLATSDLGGQVTIFNLDTLQLHSLLPTFPIPPASLDFVPTHPTLSILHPTQSLQFYHLDQRRLLPPTQQLSILNSTLRSLHSSAQQISFEPSRSNPRAVKTVLCSHDWLATCRLDMELIVAGHKNESSRAIRRKRAREAREALELSSASPSISSELASAASASASLSASASSSSLSKMMKNAGGIGTATGSIDGNLNSHPTVSNSHISSANDPEFVKVNTERFRAVVSVGWIGEGEMVVVERPYADYVGELPGAFFVAGYGRS